MKISTEDKRQLTRQIPTVDIVVFDSTTQQNVGRLVDLTAKGLRVRGKEQLNSGFFYQLRLEIMSQDALRNGIDFEATCLWSEIIRGTDEFDSGLIMVDLSSEQAQRIGKLLDSPLFENGKKVQT